MKKVVFISVLFVWEMSFAGIMGLWKGPSLVYKQGELSVCEMSLYLKQKPHRVETLTSVVCKENESPLRLMSQSFDVDKNEIIHEHIKGRVGPSNLTAKAAYNKNHHIKVNMKVNHNLMMYDFTEDIHNNLSVIQGTLIKQDF
ncbi:MAG: hypothetical protein MK008_13560 [Bdellovibrionales bacterium]|nr:hypothetical protein [Bdellovibrionales bacterium]